jgi:hypothetical protein
MVVRMVLERAMNVVALKVVAKEKEKDAKTVSKNVKEEKLRKPMMLVTQMDLLAAVVKVQMLEAVEVNTMVIAVVAMRDRLMVKEELMMIPTEQHLHLDNNKVMIKQISQMLVSKEPLLVY